MIQATLKYHLRNVKDKTYVYLSISNGANNRFRIFPNIRLNDKNNWNKDKEKIKVTPAEPNAKSLNDKLYEFKTHFIEELKECYKNDIRLDKDVIKRIEKTFGNSVTNKKIKLTNDKFDYIFHFAAESHVDNSISGPKVFIESNVLFFIITKLP